MEIVDVKQLEDCFDGDSSYCYSTRNSITEDDIKNFKEIGEIEYYPDFPRPFFRVTTPDGLQVKGVEGECSFTAIFPKTKKEVVKSNFEQFLKFEKTISA